jgi:tetratricopeptide (TPR) repeat protein
MKLKKVFFLLLMVLAVGLPAALTILKATKYDEVLSNRFNGWLLKQIEQGESKEANEAIAKNPNDISAYFKRADARSRWGNRSGAILDFTKVIQLSDRNNIYLLNIALDDVYYRRGQEYNSYGYSHQLDKKIDQAKRYYELAIADYRNSANLSQKSGDAFWYQQSLDSLHKVEKQLFSICDKTCDR